MKIPVLKNSSKLRDGEVLRIYRGPEEMKKSQWPSLHEVMPERKRKRTS